MTDDLLTIAEVVVALAGFSALISVLAARGKTDAEKKDGLMLLVALEACLVVAVFAVLPVALFKFELAADVVWRCCAGLYLIADVLFTIAISRRTPGTGFYHRPWVGKVIWPLSIAGQLSLVLVVLDLSWAPLAGLYFLALYVNTINAGLVFVNVAWSTFVIDPESSE